MPTLNELPGGWLAGCIVDTSDAPIAGATITSQFFDRSGEVTEHKTVLAASDASGRFRIGPLPACPDPVLWCEAKGFARTRVGDERVAQVAVLPNATNYVGSITLLPEAVLTGRVTDPAGRNVVDATIRVSHHVYQLAHTVALDGPAQVVRTGASGEFRVGSLSPGWCSIEASTAGYPTHRSGALIPAGPDLVDVGTIAFEGGGTAVAGRVIDLDGKPISGVRISVNGDQDHGTVTNDDGVFDFVARTARVATISATRPSGQRLTTRVRDANDIQLRLPRSHVLEGTWTDETTGQAIEIEDVSVCEETRREADGAVSYVG